MDEDVKKVCTRIRLLRISRNIAQNELAQTLGITQTNLSHIENGRTGATLKNLFKIREDHHFDMRDFYEEGPVRTEAAVPEKTEEPVAPDPAEIMQAFKVLKQLLS